MNFRCFEFLEIFAQPDINVFVGINGSGKSAILDAMAVALYDKVSACGEAGPREQHGVVVKPEDFHAEPDRNGVMSKPSNLIDISIETEWKEEQCATILPASGLSESSEKISSPYNAEGKVIHGKKCDIGPGWNRQIVLEPNRKVSYRENTLKNCFCHILPAIAYYRSKRGFNRMFGTGDVFDQSADKSEAFSYALDAGVDFNGMLRWFYLRENNELREKLQLKYDPDFEYPDLAAIRKALIRVLENVKKVFFWGTPPRLMVETEGSKGVSNRFSIDQLSDGYRNLLAIVLDFARRQAQANPGLDNPLEAPGILLIDEIELHLHPKWQQTIISRLREVFPNTQLFVTTHSPQVLTTVENRNIFIVRDRQLRAATTASYGAESKKLLERVLGVSSRPPAEDNEFVRAIEHLFHLIDQEKLNEAQQKLDELMKEVGYDEPALIEAQTIIENRLWEKEAEL